LTPKYILKCQHSRSLPQHLRVLDLPNRDPNAAAQDGVTFWRRWHRVQAFDLVEVRPGCRADPYGDVDLPRVAVVVVA
jgi:hypothetical protein